MVNLNVSIFVMTNTAGMSIEEKYFCLFSFWYFISHYKLHLTIWACAAAAGPSPKGAGSATVGTKPLLATCENPLAEIGLPTNVLVGQLAFPGGVVSSLNVSPELLNVAKVSVEIPFERWFRDHNIVNAGAQRLNHRGLELQGQKVFLSQQLHLSLSDVIQCVIQRVSPLAMRELVAESDDGAQVVNEDGAKLLQALGGSNRKSRWLQGRPGDAVVPTVRCLKHGMPPRQGLLG